MSAGRFGELARRFAQTPADAWPQLAAQRFPAEPHCAISRYLLGCYHYDRGRPATGVRQFMIAHHALPQLQSAALLAFAGLNWVVRRRDPLLVVLLQTWDEFRRPEFDRYPRERALLDALAAQDPGLSTLPPLARRLWRLPIQGLRTQIQQAVLSRDAGVYPLLALPA